jgi:hypothetical protein
VSTPAWLMILPIIGLRMSARTNSVRPIGCGGGTTSTPMIRSTESTAPRARAKTPPMYRETPVTSTTEATTNPLPTVPDD